MTARDSEGRIERTSEGNDRRRARGEAATPITGGPKSTVHDAPRASTPETRVIALAFIDDFKQRHGYEFEELFESDLLHGLEKMLDERAGDLVEAHVEETGQPCVWRS